MVSMKKVSVTINEDVLARARELVGARGLSHYLSEALRLHIQHDSIGAWLAEAEARAGPIPDEIRAEAQLYWPQG